MRLTLNLLNAVIGICLVALLGGCSSSGSLGIPSSSFEARHGPQVKIGSVTLKELAVSDLGGGTILSRVELLDKAYEFTGTITDGIDGATGDWFDSHGNLYVGNYAVPMVQEYAKGKRAPAFTYSAGLERPYSVTTDAADNVYVADEYNPYGSGGGVVEFAQNSNVVLAQCLSGLNATGLAIDKHGDVFSLSTSGTLLEYKGGLSGCKPKTLGVTLPSGGGLLIDKKGDLVACAGHVVDVIAPPYTAVSLTISGFGSAAHDALSKDETLLFVADPQDYDVQVLTYPGGSYVTTLDSSNGLIDPIGVATYPASK